MAITLPYPVLAIKSGKKYPVRDLNWNLNISKENASKPTKDANNITNTKKLNGIETVQAMEFTFYKKDRNNQNGYQTSFPHDLDRDNEHNQPTIVLPKSWFKN